MGDYSEITKQNYDWSLYNARFEYAWKYFDFHAAQRTTMFNFFIIFSGVFINACVKLLENKFYTFLGIASFIGIVITFMFICLERRNEELVHIAEDILRILEKEVLFKDFNRQVEWPKRRNLWGKMIKSEKYIPTGIFIRQDYDKKQKCGESKNCHGRWLPLVELMICIVYLFFVVWSLMQMSRVCIV